MVSLYVKVLLVQSLNVMSYVLNIKPQITNKELKLNNNHILDYLDISWGRTWETEVMKYYKHLEITKIWNNHHPTKKLKVLLGKQSAVK